jgi:hypothetical protein
MKLPLFLIVFVNVHIHFQIWTRIRNPRVTDPDPAKVSDPCGSGSGSTTLSTAPVRTDTRAIYIHTVKPAFKKLNYKL